jgi:hypothetical protein
MTPESPDETLSDLIRAKPLQDQPGSARRTLPHQQPQPVRGWDTISTTRRPRQGPASRKFSESSSRMT